MHPPRKDTIGARSATGPARVEVYDATGAVVATGTTEATNHCWVAGLDAGHRLHLQSHREGRGVGGGRAVGLVGAERRRSSRPAAATTTASARIPIRRTPAGSLTFAVIGDFGVGVKHDARDRRQQQIADGARIARSTRDDVRFVLTTGDNIYAGKQAARHPDRRDRAMKTTTGSSRSSSRIAT